MCFERYVASDPSSSPQFEREQGDDVAEQPDIRLLLQEQLQQKEREVTSLKETIEVHTVTCCPSSKASMTIPAPLPPQVMASVQGEKLKETEEKLKATIESNEELRVRATYMNTCHHIAHSVTSSLVSSRWPLKKLGVSNKNCKRRTPT